MLQENIKIYEKQITELQQANEELEQSCRRLCVRANGISNVDNKTSDRVLDKVKSLNRQPHKMVKHI